MSDSSFNQDFDDFHDSQAEENVGVSEADLPREDSGVKGKRLFTEEIFEDEAGNEDSEKPFSDQVEEELSGNQPSGGAQAPFVSVPSSKPQWYCAHTYSGYEKKVKTNIEKTIANRHLQDQILEVRVPVKVVRELRNGAFHNVERKVFPGYVLVNMVMNDETWRIVRYTRGVTGFVGPESKAVPLQDDQVMPAVEQAEGIYEMDLEKGDLVEVVTDPWKGEQGVIFEIDPVNEKLILHMDIVRSGPSEVEVGLTDVRKKL